MVGCWVTCLLQESSRERDLPLRQRLGLLEEAHEDTHDEIIRIRTNVMGEGEGSSRGLENMTLCQCVRVTHVEMLLSQ